MVTEIFPFMRKSLQALLQNSRSSPGTLLRWPSAMAALLGLWFSDTKPTVVLEKAEGRKALHTLP